MDKLALHIRLKELEEELQKVGAGLCQKTVRRVFAKVREKLELSGQ